MWGTIPQWITVAVIMVIALVEVTRWPGFTPEWVSAVATAVLALAAIAGLGGVLVPLQVARSRRRTLHLEKIDALVLEPIRQKLEGWDAVVLRTGLPLSWQPHGLEAHLPSALSLGLFEQIYDVKREDASLHDTVYADVKRNHYPRLLTEWEQFQTEIQHFVESDLLTFAKSLYDQLCASNPLPDLGKDGSAQRGCYYASLALYMFNRVWTKGYSSELSVQPDSGGKWELVRPMGEHYTRATSQDDVTALNDRVEALVVKQYTTDRVSTLGSRAAALDEKRRALLKDIARIRLIGKLAGVCEATR